MNNQLFKGALGVIKADNIYTENHATKNLSTNIDESTFVNGISAIINKNKTYTESKLALYKAMSESSELAKIHEGFADYAAQASDITEEFLKFISNKIDERCAMIDDFVSQNKTIASHKKALTEEIKHYTDDSREGYEYTFDDNIPNVNILERFNESLFEELVTDQWTDLSEESIRSILSNMNLEEDYRKARAAVLNTDASFSENEFEQALRLIYRNGKSSMVELYITESDIKDIADKWFNHKEYYNACLKNDMKKLVNATEKVMDRIEAVCRNNNGLTLAAFTNLLPGDIRAKTVDGKDIDLQGMRISGDMMVQLDLFCKIKLDQLQKYTDILCMALTAKADAMFSELQQNSVILLDAIEILDHPSNYYDARQ